MNSVKLRKYGTEMIEKVASYWETIRKRNPISDVEPGFLNKLVGKEIPEEPESWEEIFKDIESVAIEGNTHWQHPNFYAYFPTGCSYHSIMGDILSDGLASIGFTWKSSPPMTELELHVTDWLAKALGFPNVFLNMDSGTGGGMIQNTASDATFIAFIAARGRAVENLKAVEQENLWSWLNISKFLTVFWPKFETTEYESYQYLNYHNPEIIKRLIAYTSDQAHSSVEKSAMLAAVRLRKLKSIRGGPLNNFRITPEVLKKAIKEDKARGLIPYILVITVGTTPTCAVDVIEELAPICNEEGIWVHIDSAYAGSFAICPEYRYLLKGVEFADSINTNVHKALQVNFDCSPMWFKDMKNAVKYFNVDPVYLKHDYQSTVMDFRHLQVGLGRRFRSLKMWFLFRNMGLKALQENLRKSVELAKYFEELIQSDDLLETFVPRHLGLVCFRLKNQTNAMNEQLQNELNKDKRIFLVPSKVNDEYFLRFSICSPQTTKDDVKFAYDIIYQHASKIKNQQA